MEAEELTWHSDHTTQEVLDLTIRQATTGATAENPIEITDNDSDSDDGDQSSVTETEWDEYFAAGAEHLEEALVVDANVTGRDCDHLPDGSVVCLPSLGTEPAMLSLRHALRINMTRTPTILYCMKCAVLTDQCLTDAQIRLVTFYLMPQLHRSIMRGKDSMSGKMDQLRMIVRLYMMDSNGVDKIGHCLRGDLTSGWLSESVSWHLVSDLVADAKPDAVPAWSCVPTARTRDLEHFD